MIDFLSVPASLWSLSGPYCTELSAIPQCSVCPMNRHSTPIRAVLQIYCLQIDILQVLLHSQSIMAFKWITKLTCPWPQSASPNSLDCGLQVHLQTYSITASKVARSMAWNLFRFRPANAPLSSLYLGLQVHHQTDSITGSKCISQFTRTGPRSAFPNQLDHGLQVPL